jgi:hypothetical protein
VNLAEWAVSLNLPGHFHYFTLGSNRLNTQFVYKPITSGKDAGPILAWFFPPQLSKALAFLFRAMMPLVYNHCHQCSGREQVHRPACSGPSSVHILTLWDPNI